MTIAFASHQAFFEAELLNMGEFPKLSARLIDPQPAFGEFGNQPTQGEIACLDPLQNPDMTFARNRLRPVPAHFARREAAALALPSDPSNGRTDGNREPLGCLVARQPQLTTVAN